MKKLQKDCLQVAEQHYAEVEYMVKNLARYAAVTGGVNAEEIIKHFDLVLQGILLCVAAEDGMLWEAEKKFIKQHSKRADLMEYLANDGREGLTWDSFSILDAQEKKDLAFEILSHDLKDELASFILPFAAVDSIHPKDYCKEVTGQILLICGGLCGCDNDDACAEKFKKEFYVAFTLVQETIKNVWQEVANDEERISEFLY